MPWAIVTFLGPHGELHDIAAGVLDVAVETSAVAHVTMAYCYFCVVAADEFNNNVHAFNTGILQVKELTSYMRTRLQVVIEALQDVITVIGISTIVGHCHCYSVVCGAPLFQFAWTEDT